MINLTSDELVEKLKMELMIKSILRKTPLTTDDCLKLLHWFTTVCSNFSPDSCTTMFICPDTLACLA